ncbi:MAG: TrmH family RNA methyltransferase [Aeriscardovia sp.]|nr:TrmH family RNA methyltransferase [Aeriscardovia sp.]
MEGEPSFRKIGLGPWKEEFPGREPDDPRFDPELLEEGDRRNVQDRYRYWSVEAIRKDLDRRGYMDLEIACENWTHDFNIGSMVRSANAFGARAVHIVGPHKWNRKGSLMTEVYERVYEEPSIAHLEAYAKASPLKPHLVAVDNIEGSVPIETFKFPPSCILIFGSEGEGLTREALSIAEATVYIEQRGSVRSINAAAAAAIAMYAYSTCVEKEA